MIETTEEIKDILNNRLEEVTSTLDEIREILNNINENLSLIAKK